MLSSDHLRLKLLRLKNGDEWSQRRTGLGFLFSKGGSGTCVSDTLNQLFLQGDVLILNGPNSARLVSANGEIVFWNFSLSLEHLFPLFAETEISLLQNVAEHLKTFKHYPATTSVATECHRLIREVPPQFNLDHRSQLLRVAAAALATEFDSMRDRCGRANRMEEHLVHVFENLSAEEILRLSIDELAKRFGCSRRHLNRLFHQYFSLSVAALKMEMRLLKAVSLLRDPSSKIISVAEGCGFHHLGLFNTCFRKRFGTSPGEWRRRGQTADPRLGGFLHESPDCPLRTNGLCPWSRGDLLKVRAASATKPTLNENKNHGFRTIRQLDPEGPPHLIGLRREVMSPAPQAPERAT